MKRSQTMSLDYYQIEIIEIAIIMQKGKCFLMNKYSCSEPVEKNNHK